MQQPESTIKESVLAKISQERLTPTNRWYFRAQHAVLWLPGIAVTILGSFAIAGILFSTVHAGWQYRGFVHESLVGFLSQVIPLLWLVSLALFGSIVVKTFRLTARGYRYKTGIILLMSFLISVILGAALFALDAVAKQGNRLVRFQTERTQRLIWTNPEEGRLAGVIDIEGDLTMLTDTNGKRWVLETSEVPRRDLLVDDRSVRVIGVAQDSETFFACIIVPWELTPLPHRQGAPLPPPSAIRRPVPGQSPICADILKERRVDALSGNVAPVFP